jgi:hypothetical protein
MKIDWKRKLTSRKLWLSVASFVTMLMIYFGKSESEAAQVAAIIMAGATVIGYVVGEGLADSKNAGKEEDDGETIS